MGAWNKDIGKNMQDVQFTMTSLIIPLFSLFFSFFIIIYYIKYYSSQEEAILYKRMTLGKNSKKIKWKLVKGLHIQKLQHPRERNQQIIIELSIIYELNKKSMKKIFPHLGKS